MVRDNVAARGRHRSSAHGMARGRERIGAAAVLAAAALGLLMSGCRDDGGGRRPPAAPVLSLSLQQVKILHFSWTDVEGETAYELLEDPDGSSGFTTVATLPADTTSHDLAVSLHERLNAVYKLRATNAAGSSESDPVAVNGSLREAIGYFKASNTGSEDAFGSSVALSADGSTLAVGAPLEDSTAIGIGAPLTGGAGTQQDDGAADSGAVYLY